MGSSAGELDLSSSRSSCSSTYGHNHSPPSFRIMGERQSPKNSRPPTNCSRTPPNCARCRNHNIIVELRGHKRYCSYSACTCSKCILTAERQKVMAKQTAMRRAEDLDRKRRLEKGLPVPGYSSIALRPVQSPVHTPPPRSPSPEPGPGTGTGTGSTTPPPPKPLPVPTTAHTNTKPAGYTNKGIWESISLLLYKYHLPIHTAPLLHIILSRIASDPDDVFRLIEQAECEVKRLWPVNEDALRQVTAPVELTPWPLYLPPATPQHSIMQPTALYKPHFHPSPVGLSAFRHHPYHPTAFGRTLDSLGYSLLESGRPTVLMSTEYLHNKYNECLELKPATPSSVRSDKSSCGSVDV